MIYQDYYSTPGVRKTCHMLKRASQEEGNEAIEKAARYLALEGKISSACYLVPAPQHTGSALYTRVLCQRITELTGARLLDIVKCKPHEPIYDQKKARPEEAPEAEYYLVDEPPKEGTFLFIDNVIATGSTFNRINELFDKRLKPMPYAVDYTRLKDREILDILCNFQRQSEYEEKKPRTAKRKGSHKR